MTSTSLRPADGRRTQTAGTARHGHTARLTAALRHGAGRARCSTAQTARFRQGAGPMWSLLLPPFCANNSTEDAMPDPDAGPSHRPGARILGGLS